MRNSQNNFRNRAKRIKHLQQQLNAVADPAFKQWSENYLKGVIKYRGVRVPIIAELVVEWHQSQKVEELTVKEQVLLAADLIRQDYGEDKVAGMIYIQKYLLSKTSSSLLLKTAETLFKEGAFYEWSTTDWFCIRVLGPVVARHEKGSALRVANWKSSECLWQRRSSLVPFRAALKDASYDPLIVKTIATLIKEEERFIQTAIGWVVSDLSKLRPTFAAGIVEKYFDRLSGEVIHRHTKYLPKHKHYKEAKKAGLAKF